MKNRITFFAISLIVVTYSNPLFSQIQLGADIDGEATEDRSGRLVSLSSDGSRVAIGARNNDGTGIDAGHVRVYEWDGGAWTQLGEDIDGEAAGDESGHSVSLSSDGSRVAIGAQFNDGNGSSAGHVRIYEWLGGAWTQMGGDINGETAEGRSGHSVSLSSDGSRVAIGAPWNDGTGTDAGHVRVYQWFLGAWTQFGADIDGEAAGDRFGAFVSLSSDGSRVAIGAPRNDGTGTDAGHVRIYEWLGGAWTQVGADIDGEAADDHSGICVSLSSDGSQVAIGAEHNAGINGDYSGHVRVYKWNGGNWEQVGQDIDGEAAFDNIGYSVSLSSDGSRVAAGAWANDGINGDLSGHARVYEWIGGVWTQVGADMDGEAADDFSGRSVSLSPDGIRVAIGAARNGGNGFEAGHVRVYELEPVSTIATNSNEIIEIYPNPTSGKIELFGVEHGTIKIIDNFGRIILKAEQSVRAIDISNLMPGIYFLQVSSDNNLITKKIIKK